MEPHYRRSGPSCYISYYCQDEVKAMFDKLSAEKQPSYEYSGIKAFEIPVGSDGDFVTVLHDTRDAAEVREAWMSTKKPKNIPEAVAELLSYRYSPEQEEYFIATTDRSAETIVLAARSVDAQIGEDMCGYLRAAYSEEPELVEFASTIKQLSPMLDKWARENNQFLKYDGTDQMEERWKLQEFIASYANLFVMNDTLMLTHSGSHQAFAYREDEDGPTWYCVDYGYGYDEEEKTGNLVDQEYDSFIDSNGHEHLNLKHMFKDENKILLTYDNAFIPVSPIVESLHIFLSHIAEKLELNKTTEACPSL